MTVGLLWGSYHKTIIQLNANIINSLHNQPSVPLTRFLRKLNYEKEHVYTSVKHPMDLRLKSYDLVQGKIVTRSFWLI